MNVTVGRAGAAATLAGTVRVAFAVGKLSSGAVFADARRRPALRHPRHRNVVEVGIV